MSLFSSRCFKFESSSFRMDGKEPTRTEHQDFVRTLPSHILFNYGLSTSSPTSTTSHNHEQKIRILNTSAVSQSLKIHSPTTAYFSIHKNHLKDLVLASGLSTSISVFFHHAHLKHHQTTPVLDTIRIETNGNHFQTVTLEAQPIRGKIMVDETVQFGAIYLNDIKPNSSFLTHQTKLTEIRNMGPVGTRYRIELNDPTQPLCIAPTSGYLGAAGEKADTTVARIRIQFTPMQFGPFNADVTIHFESDDESSHLDTTAIIRVSAVVTQNKLQCSMGENGRDIFSDLASPIAFGQIFFNQKTALTLNISNQCPCYVKWVRLLHWAGPIFYHIRI